MKICEHKVATWGRSLVIAAALVLVFYHSRAVAEEGGHMSKLELCPETPNCVCSLEPRESHQIAPLRYEGDGNAAWDRLRAVMAERKRTKLVEEGKGYLHYVETTLIMRFKDDVEFSLNENANQIEVRSASRVGRSDLGVNRKRVEAIREAFGA